MRHAPGSYAERIALSADALVRVPDVIDDRTAAAGLSAGMGRFWAVLDRSTL
jgi:NADPH:quinone reductase